MVKHCVKMWFIELGVSTGITFIMCIANLIFLQLFNILGIIIFNAILATIISLIVNCAIVFYVDDEDHILGFFVGKVTFGKIFPIILPILITGLCLLILLIYAAINELFQLGEPLMLYGVLTDYTACYIVYFLIFTFYYLSHTCPKCGAICSYDVIKKTDYRYDEYDRQKTKEYTETVGSLYIDNTKVGDVNKNSYATYTQHVKHTSWRECRKCRYCGREKWVNCGHSIKSDWK